MPYRYELVSRDIRRVSASDRQLFDVTPSGSVVELACRHFAGRKPFCLEQRLISLAAVPEAADESFAELAPGPWLLAACRGVPPNTSSARPRPGLSRRRAGDPGGKRLPGRRTPHLERRPAGDPCPPHLCRRRPRAGGAICAIAGVAEQGAGGQFTFCPRRAPAVHNLARGEKVNCPLHNGHLPFEPVSTSKKARRAGDSLLFAPCTASCKRSSLPGQESKLSPSTHSPRVRSPL